MDRTGFRREAIEAGQGSLRAVPEAVPDGLIRQITWVPSAGGGSVTAGFPDRRAAGRVAHLILNVAMVNTMRITFDRGKREQTLQERGLDFRQAKEVFDGLHLTRPDERKDYGESRFISMRKANEREITKARAVLGVIATTPRRSPTSGSPRPILTTGRSSSAAAGR